MTKIQKVLIINADPQDQATLTSLLDESTSREISFVQIRSLVQLQTYLSDPLPPDLILINTIQVVNHSKNDSSRELETNGFELCQEIRKAPHLRNTKTLLFIHDTGSSARQKVFSSGGDEFIIKPLVSAEVEAKIRQFLRYSQIERLLGEKSELTYSAQLEALGEMAGGIAHEINTPLSTISIVGEQIGELLNEEKVDRIATHKMTLMIDETVQRIATVVRGLKAFAREGSHDKFISTPFKKILLDTLLLCSERMKKQGIQLKIGPISDALNLECQSVQISQVLLHLLHNACDAVANLDERWIQIDVQIDAGFVQIQIMDSGSRIPDYLQAQIFLPFFTTKEIGKGTGLGLSISKGIVENHQGKLQIDSDNPYTCFVLSLPILLNPQIPHPINPRLRKVS